MDAASASQSVVMDAISRQQTVSIAALKQQKQAGDALVAMLNAAQETAKAAPAPGTGLVVDTTA
ncbi:hypothetical protein HDIA_4374 [Hartmannibacter diazotrophicus]|uniref:Motility protein n=1 Tax=Hartmannibacter diazotrophicus TaxID=1482074 RepID=A0A2C9DE35_9HYPH|nr:hypothetical protein [Hartmannibacter diazotrophicus]SON57915.1 hypothetical protein HDIA_4374 [Hartmannibacter diazotrophicus]